MDLPKSMFLGCLRFIGTVLVIGGEDIRRYLPRLKLGSKGKVDPKALEAYVLKHPESLLKDMSKVFGVSMGSISKRLKRLGFTNKKNPIHMWKQTKRREKSI